MRQPAAAPRHSPSRPGPNGALRRALPLVALLALLLLPGGAARPARAAPGDSYYRQWVRQNHDRATTFAERRQAFLIDNGAFFADDHPYQAVWAWLENDDPRKAQGVQMLLAQWDAETCAANAAAYRALMHPNTPPAERQAIIDRYQQEVDLASQGKGIFGGANLNQGIQKVTGLYLFLQTHPESNLSDVRYTYPDGDPTFKDFCYQGRCYARGQRYDLFQLLEDYLQYRFDWYVSEDFSSSEFDVGAYMWTYVEAALLLHDFAVDTPLRQHTSAAKMRTKAKMAVDFLLLDMGMDFSADQWGGAKGRREYYSYYTRKKDITAQQCILLGLGCAYSAPYKPYYDAYLTDYRAPELILDVTDIRDEPDDYWHQHMEYNAGAARNGKLTFVTKFYNLGGGFDYSWVLNVKSDTRGADGARLGVPFRLWTRDTPIHDDVGDYAWPEMLPGGEFGQYRNALFSREKNQNLHVFTALHQDNYQARLAEWDVFQRQGNRYLLQEGRTMVILEMDAQGVFLEVAIQGVDYPDLESFQRAFVGGNTTSRGDRLSKSPSTGEVLVNGQPVYQYPFDRLETIDNRGQYIIRWESKVMTVARHGRTCTYDFNTWTYQGDCGSDPPPPQPCSPDLNGDGKLNALDLQALANLILGGDPGAACADLNGDGALDSQDLELLASSILTGQ